MAEGIIGTIAGFAAGLTVSLFSPPALYVKRFLWRLRTSALFEIDGEDVLLGPDDHVEWKFEVARARNPHVVLEPD